MSFNSKNQLKMDDFIKNTYKFGEICEVLNGRAYKKNELLESGKYTVLRVGNFFSSDHWYYSDLELDANKYCDNGDLLFAWSASFGPKIWDGGKVIYHYHIWKLVPSPFVDTKFLYYWLLFSRNKMLMGVHGSVMGHLTKSSFEKQKISLPDILEQKAIAHILSTLDDKIEVNNQINKTLENMAQAIFKQWFVDFEFPNEDGEPYKSSGGEMIESELGMIPKDWEVGSFSEYISSMLGGDWGKDSPQGNFTQKVYCLRGADINDIVAGNKGKMPERYIIEKNLLKKKLNSGNLVVEISGGSPTQSTGRIAYVSNDLLKRYNSPLVATNFCRAIKLKNDEHMEFFYNYWKTFYQNNIFFHYENGTTGIKNLDISSFIERHPIIIPNENIVNMFTRQAKLFYKMHQNYGVENSQIETLRDSLLPKLMSGEIRVPLDEEGEVS